MRQVLPVLALLVVATVAASGRTLHISFAPACDSMELITSGTPEIYVGGIHDFSQCEGMTAQLYVGGFRHGFYRAIDPGGMSTILDLTDPSYGYFYSLPYPLEYLIDTDETCAWSTYYDFPGSGHVLGSTGTCTLIKKWGTQKVVKGSQPSFLRQQR
jgi:hypothetical protein